MSEKSKAAVDIVGKLMDAVGRIIPVVSVIVAVAALYISHHAYNKQLCQSERQLRQSMVIAQAQVRPYLFFHSSNIGDEDQLVLRNAGPGTAVIHKVTFYKNGIKAKDQNLKYLFDHETSREHASTFETFAPSQPVLSGEKIIVIGLSEPELKKEGFSTKQRTQIVKTFQEDASKIQVEIEYEDVLHNPQNKYVNTLQITP